MQNQNQVITKYAYFFEKEPVTMDHITGIFGGINDLWDDAEKAESELKWDQNEDENWFKKMEQEKGPAYVAAIDFKDGQVLAVKKCS